MRRTQRTSRAVLWAAVVAALAVHGAVLGSVNAFDLAFEGEGFAGGTPRKIDPAEISLQTTCSGDVLLATSARVALCLAPWQAEPAALEACGADAVMTMWMDLSGCQASGDENLIAAAPIELMPQRDADRLKPIDPEPLLAELRQQEKPQPPPSIPPPQPQAAPPPPPPPAPARPTQIVEVAKPTTEQAPDNARFVSEHDVAVAKQTVARGAVNEPMVARSKPEELTAKADPKEASVKELTEQPPGKDARAPDAPGMLAMRAPGAVAPSEAPQQARTRGDEAGTRGPLVADGFVPRRGEGYIEQQKLDPGELTRGQGGAGGGTPTVPNLKPSTEALERALGGGSVDHLEDVESGDETALSSKRWVYASFFNRLKRQVAQNWSPGVVWRRSDPNGTVHGFKTRVTEVRVSLEADGRLTKVVVTVPSGVSELDAEAVRAFKAAQPFPNPPSGLAQNGRIVFAFSFHFEIGAPRTSWRVVR